jgi:hypothetical protein
VYELVIFGYYTQTGLNMSSKIIRTDAIREVQKYSSVGDLPDVMLAAGADTTIHMRLFRAQRNLYVSGCAVLMAVRCCCLFIKYLGKFM